MQHEQNIFRFAKKGETVRFQNYTRVAEENDIEFSKGIPQHVRAYFWGLYYEFWKNDRALFYQWKKKKGCLI